MVWNSTEFDGIVSISVDSGKVWTPAMIAANSADRLYSYNEGSFTVRYTSTGLALWQPGNVIKTVCSFQIAAYPFDVHKCFVNVTAWGSLPTEILLQAINDSIVTYVYYDNAEWDLIGTSTRNIVTGNNQMSLVCFGLKFRRKSHFLVVNILVPLVFLSILNTVVFLLPQESGERVSFSVTVLLSFTVFLSIIGDNVPKTSSPMPLLCKYIIVVLITSGLIARTSMLKA